MRTFWNFYSAGQLAFGRGAVKHVGSLAAKRGLQRVFVVSDARLLAAGLIERVTQPLREAMIEVEVFAGGEPEPAIATAMAATETARKFRPDAILGLGGGSNMDL